MSQGGFSLVEVMIGLAIAGVVSLAMFSAFISQNQSYIAQEQVVAMQQNLRAAFTVLERDLRMAGFVGDGGATAGIAEAGEGRLRLTYDLGNGTPSGNPDGDVLDNGEHITYGVYSSGGVNKLGRKVLAGGNYQPVAENISALGFAYAFDADFDSENQIDRGADGRVYWGIINPLDNHWYDLDVNDDGDISPADDLDGDGLIAGQDTGLVASLDQIRGVRAWLLAETAIEARDFRETNLFQVGSRTVKPNNQKRHRLLTATIFCRNLGL